jgi:ribosomal protein S18 acetylase RimI-like enzyme
VPDIVYASEPNLAAEEFTAVLNASGLGERRPVSDPARIGRMLASANVIVTARHAGRLVGVSRGMSDHGFAFYLSDLAVDRDFQGSGIGRKLIALSHEAAGMQTTLILLAAPGARTYYPHVGLEYHDSCWIIPRQQ